MTSTPVNTRLPAYIKGWIEFGLPIPPANNWEKPVSAKMPANPNRSIAARALKTSWSSDGQWSGGFGGGKLVGEMVIVLEIFRGAVEVF
jgi:hypothetical protein